MKRTSAETVGEIITRVLKNENLDGRLNEQRAVSLWAEVVGPVVNRHTVQRYVKDGIMYAYISSAPLRNELMLHRTTLIRSLNNAVGSDCIKEIIFR